VEARGGSVFLIFQQTVKDFLVDNGPEWAAAIAYYSMLSIFPLMLAAAGVASYFVDRSYALSVALRFLSPLLPGGSDAIISIVQEAINARGSISIISIAFLLWSGMRIFSTLMTALNIAYGGKENYSFFQRLGIELLMLLSIGVLFLVTFIFQLAISQVGSIVGPKTFRQIAGLALGEIFSFLLLTLAFFLTYRYVPRCPVHRKPALVGAVFAAALFRIVRPLFTDYITNFANYNLVYGSLALLISLVVWTWVVGLIYVFGGELAAHLQAMVIEKKPAQEVEQGHLERAPTRSSNIVHH
jgi:membrane protein